MGRVGLVGGQVGLRVRFRLNRDVSDETYLPRRTYLPTQLPHQPSLLHPTQRARRARPDAVKPRPTSYRKHIPAAPEFAATSQGNIKRITGTIPRIGWVVAN